MGMVEPFSTRMADEKVVLALAVYCMEKLNYRQKKRRKRSFWVKPYLAERAQKSNYQLVQDLRIRIQDKHEYRAYLRMDTASFTVRIFHIFAYTV